MIKEDLINLIEEKEAKVGIIGMGYVGLPLVREFSSNGFTITGFDIDKKKVEQLNAGKSYIKHIPSETISEFQKKGLFTTTCEFSTLADMDAIIICVPTPLSETREPDLSFIEKTSYQISKNMTKGQLIVLESTTYPGTTRERVLPILEQSGLKCGKDFFLSYSPEREDPGNEKYTTGKIPKVVGGLSKDCLDIAVSLYEKVVEEVIPVSSLEVAEATKILENIYRSVNIALVNELKVLFNKMNIDIWDVIAAASTKPFGFQPFYPGPGLGGHCIPIDPFYLTWKAREYNMPTRFIELAGEVNTSMPEYVIKRVTEALNLSGLPLRGAKIIIIGVTYKRNVDDMREAPVFEIINIFMKSGAKIVYNDPYVPNFPPTRKYKFDLKSTPLSPGILKEQDCVLIITDHSDYDYDWIVKNSNLVVDTRGATKEVKEDRDKIIYA